LAVAVGSFATLAPLMDLLMLGSTLPSAIGLGQGIAALRARGDHMILATLGLILCGLNVGVCIGLYSFRVALQL
jgi:hypothetical protein